VCRENKIYFIILLASLLFCYVWGVLQAEEQWYLITGPELRSIGRYRETSIQEKQSLLSLVNELRGLESRRKTESENLNRQLSAARENQKKSEQLFNEYEAAQLTLLSSKNGEIAGLQESLAAEKLRLQKSRNLNIILGGILGLIAVLAAVFVYVKVRTGGLKLPKLF
jgi:23S rRNA pseudoU1915 N3-methylase RlmH